LLEYMRREEKPIPPDLVAREPAPCKKVVLLGDEVDVTELPTLKYHALDSGQVDPDDEAFQGRYIALGYDTMRGRDTGVPNVSIYRLQMKEPRKFGVQIKQGRPTDMAAFTTEPFLKYVVVDEDVASNDSEVLHAIATRVRWNYDALQVTCSRASALDPVSYDSAGRLHLVTRSGSSRRGRPTTGGDLDTGVGQVDLSEVFGDAWKRVRQN
jgi:3-polyprenyl-4-hydroxybenzoate decarboxylase